MERERARVRAGDGKTQQGAGGGGADGQMDRAIKQCESRGGGRQGSSGQLGEPDKEVCRQLSGWDQWEKTAQINTSLITRVKHSQPPDMWTGIKMKELKMGGDGGVWVGGETGRDGG
ncbi:unnamed protein product [Arctogadus glacialis]